MRCKLCARFAHSHLKYSKVSELTYAGVSFWCEKGLRYISGYGYILKLIRILFSVFTVLALVRYDLNSKFRKSCI